jgi:hypothetical protein
MGGRSGGKVPAHVVYLQMAGDLVLPLGRGSPFGVAAGLCLLPLGFWALACPQTPHAYA